jgi:MFS family permease
VIEGSGMGLIAVVAPAAIAMWFPPEKQGTAMGIWSTWVPVGSIIAFVLAPTIAASTSWQSIWWIGSVYSFLMLVVFAVYMRLPPWITINSQQNSNLSIRTGYTSAKKALNNGSIWGLGLVFACYTLTILGLRTFYPTFLSEMRGYTLSEAAYIASIATVTMPFSAPLVGWISDRIGSRRLVFSIPYLILAVMLLFPFKIVGWQIIVFLILQGIVTGAVPTTIFAAAPEIMKKPELAGWGMAVVMLGQNLGFFIGPIYFGNMVEGLGWVTAGYALIPICLLGFVLGLKIKVR